MIALWYTILAAMITTYVVLDGRNFGAGILHWIVARTPAERRQVIAAIGPLWSWHEVWLVGTGGVMAMSFPRLMAVGFSGYYLALFLNLWCVILRGIAIEVGGHMTIRSGAAAGTRCSRAATCCWRCFSAWRWATSCAACRSRPRARFT